MNSKLLGLPLRGDFVVWLKASRSFLIINSKCHIIKQFSKGFPLEFDFVFLKTDVKKA